MIQNTALERTGRLFGDGGINLQVLDGSPLLAPQCRAHTARLVFFNDLAQVRMMERPMEGQAHVKMRIVVLETLGRWVRKVGNLNVRVVPLWTDVCRRIWLAGVEFAQHLLFRIS